MPHNRNLLFVIFVCMLTAGCSKPAVNNTNTEAGPPAQIESVNVVEANPSETTVARGESGDVIVPIKITHGYHVNANPPSFPYLIPLEIKLPAAEGLSVEFIRYPDPLKRKFAFSEEALAVYEGETTVTVRLKADKAATPGKHNLSARLRVQACDEKVCYPPGEENLIVPVTVK